MDRKMFKSVIAASVAGTLLLIFTVVNAYAHDPSATPKPQQSHIHVKGKVTTEDGKPLPGEVRITLNLSDFFGIAYGILHMCFSDEIIITTIPAGQTDYEIIVNFKSQIPSCPDIFDKLQITNDSRGITAGPPPSGYVLRRK